MRNQDFVPQWQIEVSQADASLGLKTWETPPTKLLHWDSHFRFPFPYTLVFEAGKKKSLLRDKKTEDAFP